MKKILKFMLTLFSLVLVIGLTMNDPKQVAASESLNLQIDQSDGKYPDDRKNEKYINSYFSFNVDGNEQSIGTVINTVKFTFPSATETALVIEGKTIDGTYELVNRVAISSTTQYEYSFTLGGEFRAYIENYSGEKQSNYVTFTVATPDDDKDGVGDWGVSWSFINYISNAVMRGDRDIDLSQFKIKCEDDNNRWITWNAFAAIKDWCGSISGVQMDYDNYTQDGVIYVNHLRINGTYMVSDADSNAEFLAYNTYLKRMIDTLISRPMTDLEKVTVLNSYFTTFIGNIYGESAEAYSSLWEKDALCDGCAKGFWLMCNLAGVNCIKGGSGVSSHAWVIVQIDGKWYHIDPLWGINNPSAYFLRTDKEMIKDHNGKFNQYGTSQIYWAHTLKDAFPDCVDESYTGTAGDSYIFRKASGQIYYKNDKFLYYIKEGEQYKIYSTSSVKLQGNEVPIDTVDSINDFYAYLEAPETYLDISTESSITSENASERVISSDSSKTVSAATGEKLFLSTGAIWYTNLKDITDKKFLGMNVRECFENVGVSADYVYKIYNSDSELLATVQGAMYYINAISFNKAGTYTITASCTADNGKSGTVTMTIKATGDDIESEAIVVDYVKLKPVYDYVVWAGGTKTLKTATASIELTATNWNDSKNKSQKGSIVWYVSNQKVAPEFNDGTHKMTSKSSKTQVTVSSKGIISAVSGGETGESTAYVYACDTGSFKNELKTVAIKNAATTVICSMTSGSTAATDKISSVNLNAGMTTDKIYINGLYKKAPISSDTTYKITATKNDDYISISEIQKDEEGNSYFTVTGLKCTDKKKVASVKVTVICEQSGAKTAFTVAVAAPVKTATATLDSGSLAKKGDKAILTLKLVAENNSVTTDKITVYIVAAGPSMNGKKVSAKLSDTTLTLTASKAPTEEQFVYVVCTNAVTKIPQVFKVAKISAAGNVTIE